MKHGIPVLLILVQCLLCVPSAVAQSIPEGTKPPSESKSGSHSSSLTSPDIALRMRVWQLDETLGQKQVVDMDTLSLNFQNMGVPERNSTVAASYLANTGSAFQPMIYADRRSEERYLFAQPYDQWKQSREEWRFINTTRPYTNGSYFTTIGNDYSQEENFKFYFTANFSSRLNFGLDYEAVNARGYYTSLASRDKLAHFFGNYQSPRYEAYWLASYNKFENYENGGITDDRYITDPLTMSGGYREYESLNIPVALANTFNLTVYRDLFFSHRYHLGFWREDTTEVGDTVRNFVAVSSLIHTVALDHGRRNYDSKTANAAYYGGRAYIDDSYTADSSALTTLRNTLGLSLNEGFQSWMKFGLTAYAEHELRKYATLDTVSQPDSLGLDPFGQVDHTVENLVWVGGRLVSTQDSLLHFLADAKICLIGGEYVGNFDIHGNLSSHFNLWKHPVGVRAEGFVTNETPDFLLRHYASNHYCWDNDFENIYRVRLEGGLDIPDLGASLKAGVENISNYVYFNQSAVPAQYDGQLQVLYAGWKQHIGMGIFNVDFDAVGQLSSRESVLPLPKLAVYGNVYLKTMLSKVMLTHVGIDCRYYTAYKVPAYNPAVGMFHLQDEITAGNYPYMNAYVNFHLKRARFFVMYNHGSRLFATPDYFNAAHYPLNPASIKAGLSWNFYD